MNVEELYENRLVSMLSDYGFKITFANEKNSAFVCKALQLLLKSPEKIKKVRHLPTVFAGMKYPPCEVHLFPYFLISDLCVKIHNYGKEYQKTLQPI